MNRTDLSESFNKAAQTLEESTDSARKMLESLQQDGKLLIAPRKETMKENKTQCLKHKIGNWYSYKNKAYLLSNIQGKCVLINTDGDFYSTPVLYLCRKDIQQEVFDLACDSAVGEFKRTEVQCIVQ